MDLVPSCCGVQSDWERVEMPCCHQSFHAICIDAFCKTDNQCLACKQTLPISLHLLVRELVGLKGQCQICLADAFYDRNYNHHRKHFFHPTCIARWCGESNVGKCPTCKETLPHSVLENCKTIWRPAISRSGRSTPDWSMPSRILSSRNTRADPRPSAFAGRLQRFALQ